MTLAGLIAARIVLAVFVGGGKFVAGSGALVVDLAAHFLADFPFERDTAQSLLLVRVVYGHLMGPSLLH